MYDAPSSVERRERELERRKEEKEDEKRERRRMRGRDGLSIFIMFAPKKERQEGREGGKMETKRDGGNARVESARDARCARIYSRERAPYKEDRGEKRKLKKNKKKMCRRTNVAGRLY